MPSVIFYGAGQNAREKFNNWVEEGLTPVCFADSDIDKHNTFFEMPSIKLEILPLFEALNMYPDYELYLTQIPNSLPAVYHSLIYAGIPAKRIRFCESVDPSKIIRKSKSQSLYPQLYSIFGRLQDDISRALFLGRVEYSLTHTQTGLYRAMMQDDYMEWSYKKERRSQRMFDLSSNIWQLRKDNYPVQKNEIYFIAAESEFSWHVERFFSAMSGLGIKISGCIIPYSTVDMAEFMGISCISEEELLCKINVNTKLIAGVPVYSSLFADIIERYSEYRDSIFPLVDDLLPQYFEADILFPEENEIFVDVGVYDFVNSVEFAGWAANGYKKIYAFEPDPGCYQRCLNILSITDEIDASRVELINKGLSYKNGVLEFPAKYNPTGTYNDNEEIEIEVVSLDAFLNGNPVTFVKMDVEGAEMDVLLGMENTIKRYKPKLAVCIYHAHKDLYETMLYILSLVPEYRCYIRHYTSSELETVLFCKV
ncbi:MAG: FkbM family methyltransferase [Oscillospiraceae bacterium]|jgi:FkbM family methyltransferase|nr:FkbM family methyltransferase [Oscillospiraceae bacterium]